MKNLQAAVAQYSKDNVDAQVTISWLPFFLNPNQSTVPKEPVPIAEYLGRKFGPSFDYKASLARLNQFAEPYGFAYTPNRYVIASLPAHIIADEILRTRDAAAQDVVVQKLMTSYFVDGVDISLAANIFSICGTECFEDESAVQAMISDPDRASRVFSQADMVRKKYRITGVPHFILSSDSSSKTLSLSGAVPPSTFLETLEELG